MVLALDEDAPRCPACQAEGAPREDWGCDRLSDRDVWKATCRACRGSGGECSRCDGAGYIGVRRCPASFMQRHGRHRAHQIELFLQAWSAYRQHGIQPESGGWLDQSATWHEALRIAYGVGARIQREREESRKRIEQFRARHGAGPRGH